MPARLVRGYFPLMKKLFVTILFLMLAGALWAAPAAPRPARPEPHERAFNTGTQHLLSLRFVDAEADFREAIRLREAFAEAHLNLAFVLRKQGPEHFQEALQHYNRALELRPGFAEAFMYRGVLFVQLGDTARARADLAQLQSLRGSSARRLSEELARVIETGEEREPEQFFGVVREI